MPCVCFVLFVCFCSICPAQTPPTPVLFPLTSMFGGPYAGTMTITSQNPLLEGANSIYLGSYLNVAVNGGTNPVVSLQPNVYLVSWSGVKNTMRITVPAATNVLNALSLTTNVPVFLFTQPLLGIATNIDNATGTNVNLSGVFVGDGSALTNMTAAQVQAQPASMALTTLAGGSLTTNLQMAVNLAATNAALNATNHLGSAAFASAQALTNSLLATNGSGQYLTGIPASAIVGGVGLTNILDQALTVSGTNVQVNGAAFIGASTVTLFVTATNNLWFLTPSNLPPGLPILITVQQGPGLGSTCSFNTNGWVPTIAGNILTLPTNSTSSKEIIAVLPYSSTNANFVQTLIP